MSRLEELIAELCPDGVEYKALGEIAEIVRGNGLQKSDFQDNGVGCIHYGQIYTKFDLFAYETLTYVSETLAEKLKKVQKGNLIVAITSENYNDICKCVVWLGDEEIVTGGHAAIVKHQQDPKYLAYCFQTMDFFKQKVKLAQGTKVMEISPDRLSRIKLPVPPLEVQREIVRILDGFTLYSNELAAELAARKKQYEYYRDSLLSFEDDNSVEWMRLDEMSEIFRGGNFQKKDFVECGGCPCIHYGQIYTHFGISTDSVLKNISEEAYSKSKKASYNDIVMAVTSENIEDVCSCTVWEGKEDIAVSGHTAIIRTQQSGKFYSYFFHTKYFNNQKKKLAHGTKVIEVTPLKLGAIMVPVPSLDDQKRIVDLLDRFDTLCNDISTGLPAEIEARRKQYEYYRDKLLTFKEKK